ncbi:hypothetical protein BCR32DRAFT_268424 [Anaeromyces robustus]|uniref:Uncharacterized protein n=1 Tax=Anaeromyces robustus TaxID=1754192 RepID=A0A1Y1X5X3_9FUNG|nr:hypothetical protein BCR32DRAFT_268424 [Anaeromyces robustus]|eukprot:ORX81210.1 hypothetical protein BCR32DRAFT_268424 [Anaeromyces robustus]
MNFKIIFILPCLFGFSLAGLASSITNTTEYMLLPKYKLEDVKKLPIINCKEDSDCPNYSKGCVFDIEVDLGVCDINVYCNKFNGCVALLSTFDSSKSSNLIIDSFQTEKDTKPKNLPLCKTNENCFSNICSNGVCIVDDADPIYNCIIAEYGVHQSKVTCGKAANQLCYDHEDCISNQCFDVCDSDYYNNNHSGSISESTLSKAVLVFLLILSMIF